MPNERYLDANGLNTFWGEVKNYVDQSNSSGGGGTNFTTDNSLQMSAENMLGVTTPVQGIKTQAEFDALPADDQNKGLWVISDGESGGSSAGGEIYSTEETRIGTWIDGKPLYRKTMLYPELRTKFENDVINSKMIQINNTKNATIVKYYGTVRDAASNNLYGSIPWVAMNWASKGVWGVDIYETNGSYWLGTREGVDVAVSKLTISVTLTIEYTKPADQPEVIT